MSVNSHKFFRGTKFVKDRYRALAEGIAKPSGAVEKHFVKVLAGKDAPRTEFERQWSESWRSEVAGKRRSVAKKLEQAKGGIDESALCGYRYVRRRTPKRRRQTRKSYVEHFHTGQDHVPVRKRPQKRFGNAPEFEEGAGRPVWV